MKKDELKNVYTAVLLSIAIIFISNGLFGTKKTANVAEQTNVVKHAEIEVSAKTPVSPVVKGSEIVSDVKDVQETIDEDARVEIITDSVRGSIRLKGARLDDLVLRKYKETLDVDSPAIRLLAPSGTKDGYFAEFGFVNNSDQQVNLPNKNTIWVADSKKLTIDNPVTLTWNNGQGLVFKRVIAIDKDYMFNVTQIIENNNGDAVTLFPYGLIYREKEPEASNSSVQHMGAIGVVDGSLKEIKYKELEKNPSQSYTTTGGWIGFTDKYWLTSLVFDQTAQGVKVGVSETKSAAKAKYQADYLSSPVVVGAYQKVSVTNLLFAGAKEIHTIDAYMKKYNIDRFDLAIDFGWYYFLTKPFFYILDFLFKLFGNMGWAIICFAFALRLAMFPVANKSFVSMSKMKLVQPKVKALNEKYSNDKVRLNQEMMALYKREKINPAAGCLPMLIQIPVFFSLYKVLYISIEMRHAPFFGWIKDLAAPDPTSVFTLFGLVNWPIPSLINIGVWPLVMGITMILQQALNPTPPDKTQASVMKWMPVIFTFMLGHFASGLVIYWAWSNTLSIIQQKVIMHRLGADK